MPVVKTAYTETSNRSADFEKATSTGVLFVVHKLVTASSVTTMKPGFGTYIPVQPGMVKE